MEVVKFTEDSFKSAISSGKPVLVDFFATWCGPCKMMSPLVDQIASSRSDIMVGKVDVDECGELAAQYGVMSIPTFVIIKDGEEVARHTGSMPMASFEQFIDGAIK